MVFAVLATVVNLRLAINTQLWNPIVHFVIWGTIVVFWLLMLGYCKILLVSLGFVNLHGSVCIFKRNK